LRGEEPCSALDPSRGGRILNNYQERNRDENSKGEERASDYTKKGKRKAYLFWDRKKTTERQTDDYIKGGKGVLKLKGKARRASIE